MKLFDYANSNKEKYVFRVFVSIMVNKQSTFIPRNRGLETFEKMYHNRVEREVMERIPEEIKEILWNKIDREEMLSILMSNKVTIFDLNDWKRQERW